MEHTAARNKARAHGSEMPQSASALRVTEQRCRRIVHKYAVLAGSVSALPVPVAGVIFNDHAMNALSAKILRIFDLAGHQVSRGISEKASKAKFMGDIAKKALKSKRVRSGFVTLVSKYGVMNLARFAPGVGTAIVSVTSIAVIEYFGHQLIDDCMLIVRSGAAGRS